MLPLSYRPHRRAGLVALIVAVLCVLLPTVAFAAKGHKHPTSITITGPLTNLLFYTSYTYTVEVVSATSYKHADVEFNAPSSFCLINKPSNLVAHQPWKGSFTVAFEPPDPTNHGFYVAVLAPPTAKSDTRTVSNKIEEPTFAPNQAAAPEGYRPSCPQPLLGS
jgi:hypothetical protein